MSSSIKSFLQLRVYFEVQFNSSQPSAEYMSVNWFSIGSDNGLSPVWRQAITWTNAKLLSIRPLGTNLSENLNENTKLLICKNAL